MQKRIYTTLALITTFVLIFSSCGKYDEGPAFSLIPKKSRVANIWKIEKIFINDVDRSSLYEIYINSYKLELTNDEKLTETYTNSLGSVSENGTWELANSNADIIFTISGTKTTYKIMRLKMNEMWLERTDAGQKFTTHYVTF